MNMLQRLRDALAPQSLVLLLGKPLTRAILGISCDAGAIDLGSERCYCVRSLASDEELEKCVDIRFSFAPVEKPHIAGSLIDALIAVAKSAKGRQLAIASTDLSMLLESQLKMKVFPVDPSLIDRLLKPRHDSEALRALSEASRALQIATNLLSSKPVAVDSSERCTIRVDSSCIEVYCYDGLVGGYIALPTSLTDSDKVYRALHLAVRSGLRDREANTLLSSLAALLSKSGLEVRDISLLRLCTEGPAPYTSSIIEPPDALGIKVIALDKGKRVCIGMTTAILSSGEVRIIAPRAS